MRLLLAIAMVGCGTDVRSSGDDDDDSQVEDPFPPPPEPGVQITSGQMPLESGEEKTVCVFLDLPSDVDLQVVKLEQRNSGYAHHFILFRGGTAHEPGVGDCPSTLFIQHAPIYPGTRNQPAFAMPDGVAIPLAKRQPLILQLHLLNAGDTPVVEELRMNIYAGDPADSYQRAGVVGGSDFDFEIPAHQQFTATQRCYLTSAMKLFALTSHSHSRTLSFDVLANVSTMPIYHNESWSEPQVGQYAPALELGTFSWLEFSCTWFNETDAPIRYGETADDEMCMMFGYYYPAALDITPCAGL
jgi:hypothetical protein